MPDQLNKTSVALQQLDRKKVLGVAGSHAVTIDRKTRDGGDDIGFTSSELLLLAAGSCALAGARRVLAHLELKAPPIHVAVRYVENHSAAIDDIEIHINAGRELDSKAIQQIQQASTTGGVTGRLNKACRLLVVVN